MKKVVWKYNVTKALEPKNGMTLTLPLGSEILRVDVDQLYPSTVSLWALVSKISVDAGSVEFRDILILPTGEEFEDETYDFRPTKYINTFVMTGLVFHAFHRPAILKEHL